jgi:hypothetical protein
MQSLSFILSRPTNLFTLVSEEPDMIWRELLPGRTSLQHFMALHDLVLSSRAFSQHSIGWS